MLPRLRACLASIARPAASTLAIGLLLVAALPVAAADAPSKFELLDGDRVVMIGNTLIEREGRYGAIESMLAASYPDRRITFRNLGWSGDTVWGVARAYWEKPDEGYKSLFDLVEELKPTVVILGYGNNEAFGGPAKLQSFIEQYEKLLTDLQKHTKRIVILGLIQPTWEPTSKQHRQQIREYDAALQKLAEKHGLTFVSLADLWQDGKKPSAKTVGSTSTLTDDGIHGNTAGYEKLGQLLASRLQNPTQTEPAAIANFDELRALILAKNELFFHRWRPQNRTYIFGFR
ncbi:MAG: SGNH/GDSL hydrolase family protein, partial [Planctomycetota bacterium]|nr:SGNH/GDSL hydrolase family protein [Planctomycetota bacterium]